MSARIFIPNDRIADICQQYHISKLALFGSVLRDDFRPDSDVDVLVEFDPAHIPGLFGLARIERELTAVIGRQVDVRTPTHYESHRAKIFRHTDHNLAVN
jgi:uncharacterized protein